MFDLVAAVKFDTQDALPSVVAGSSQFPGIEAFHFQRDALCRTRLARLAEFFDKQIQFLRALAFLRFSFALCFFALSVLLETFAQRFRSVLAMLFADFGDGIALDVKAVRRFFHGLQVAKRVGVHTQSDAQALAVEVRLLGEDLFVDANGKRRMIAENGKRILKFFEQRACIEDRRAAGLIGSVHGGEEIDFWRKTIS